jgi:hypothetical protein
METYHHAWLSVHPHRSEEWLRDKLKDGFDIHHMDGNHDNNEPNNLVLVEHTDHMRLHGWPMSFLGRLGPKKGFKRKPKVKVEPQIIIKEVIKYVPSQPIIEYREKIKQVEVIKYVDKIVPKVKILEVVKEVIKHVDVIKYVDTPLTPLNYYPEHDLVPDHMKSKDLLALEDRCRKKLSLKRVPPKTEIIRLDNDHIMIQRA